MWRKVQVERPRASTSGGQSGGRGAGVEVEVEVVGGFLLAAAVSFFAMASQAETEVQERQLDGAVRLEHVPRLQLLLCGAAPDSRFAIFTQHYALG